MQFLKAAHAAGYVVIGVIIQLSNVMLSTTRVAQDVARRGHDVPDEKLQTRFDRTHRNIKAILQFVDLGLLVNNRSPDSPYRLAS